MLIIFYLLFAILLLVLFFLKDLYGKHGDCLSLQYGGSGVVHNIETYQNPYPSRVNSRDIMQTLSRWVAPSKIFPAFFQSVVKLSLEFRGHKHLDEARLKIRRFFFMVKDRLNGICDHT